MNYSEWRRDYQLKRVRLLKRNERVFGGHLRALRSRIDVPEKIDLAYTGRLRGALNDFAEEYHDSLAEQMHKSAALKMAGAAIISAPFIAAMKREHITAAVGRLDGIPEKVVTDAFSSRLPSGMTLSERVWDLRYEQDILTMLRGGMNAGLSPEVMAKQLDGFILPGRHVTTMTPYGRTLNFDSMRLARTEVMDVARSADFAMMRETPWVTGLTWEAFGANPCDHCLALAGTVYRDESEAEDTHPQCECGLVPEVISMEDWTGGLEGFMEGNDTLGIGEWLAEAA